MHKALAALHTATMEPHPNARFDAIAAELNRRCLDFVDMRAALRELMPESTERNAFHTYQLQFTVPHMVNPAGICSVAKFVELVDTINFLDPTARDRLLPGLQWAYRPWIALGRIDDTLYRLLPSIGNLWPQQHELPSTDHELLPTQFLGLNTTVQSHEPALPPNRRAANLSERSTRSAESDDIESPGFVFHELGTLQYQEFETVDEMPTTLEEGDDCALDWEPTGFCVVARLGAFGHIDGVYIVYNMFPNDEYGDRKQVIHGAWGIPPNPPGEQFSCARIGDTLGDFGFVFELAWLDKIEHPVELVRAVRSSTGGAMRLTVDDRRD